MQPTVTQKNRYLAEQNRRLPEFLVRVPKSAWPAREEARQSALPIEVWRSRGYLVQVYLQDGYERLSVTRTTLDERGRYREDISWDQLQRLKRQCGRGDRWAVEIYPDDRHVVDVQNMRHLFLLPEPPPFAWRVEAGDAEEQKG